ncbi:uncharacterized protein G2W53_018553 [Senna tora]|uniref:Uncharacterized protein n=1 Tax=Senna tora TaxID=362788 RepID=A0A834WRM5_9FABA|nr:uncharacterized protein G2W53_018553 [Senna tora]
MDKKQENENLEDNTGSGSKQEEIFKRAKDT